MIKNLRRKNIPQHVALIMDGNRRWAKRHHLPSLAGHRQAAKKTIEPLIETADEAGIKFITFWAFSTENWQRKKTEIVGLLNIFRSAFKTQADRLHKKGARIKIIGDPEKFPPDIQKEIKKIVKKTQDNDKITVIFAFNYGGRDEILRAVKKIMKQKNLRKLTEREFSNFLDTAVIPDPELIIRTGGERRLSGFLPWQGIYSELYFSKVLFPDFSPQEFLKAIRFFQQKERRFGT